MLLSAIVFLGVFLVTALLIAASGTGASERVKQTLARLDALLVTETMQARDEQIDLQEARATQLDPAAEPDSSATGDRAEVAANCCIRRT